jgi:hypothetical protein
MSEPEFSPSHSDFQWYDLYSKEDEFEQGDIILNFPLLDPPIQLYSRTLYIDEENEIRLDSDIKTYDVILMTQSCDIERFTPDNIVIFCPIYDLIDAKKPNGKSLNNPDSWNKLRKGQIVHAHLLNRCELPNFEFDYKVVDLHRVISIPLQVLRERQQIQEKRVRLLPPYREHLAQAFARQFMRVGLPLDLPSDYPYSK